MKHLFSAGIIVYRIENEQIEYLLLKYATKHYAEQHWDFAKGKIEKEETKEEAALRELQEETGLSAQIEPHFEEEILYIFRDYDGQLAQKTVYFFVGLATNNAVVLSDE